VIRFVPVSGLSTLSGLFVRVKPERRGDAKDVRLVNAERHRVFVVVKELDAREGVPPEGTIAARTELSLNRMPVSALALANGYPHSVMTAPTSPGLQAVGVPPLPLPPAPI